MEITHKQPLFIITGASCVGKSTICNELFKKESAYIVMESDLLWHEIYDTPEDNYYAYRQLWMRVCGAISQGGKPVVLCGCNTPEQMESLPQRKWFLNVYYLAFIAEEKVLKERLKKREVYDEKWILSSLHFNRWLKDNAHLTQPKIDVLDISDLTLSQCVQYVDQWIMCKIKESGEMI